MSQGTYIGNGRLGRDPETRQVGNDTVCNLNVAITTGYGEGKGTLWLRVGVWGKRGAACQQYLAKGSKVRVQGELIEREWTNGDGEVKKSLELNFPTVDFLDSKEERESRQPQTQQQQAPQSYGPPPGGDDDLPF